MFPFDFWYEEIRQKVASVFSRNVGRYKAQGNVIALSYAEYITSGMHEILAQ